MSSPALNPANQATNLRFKSTLFDTATAKAHKSTSIEYGNADINGGSNPELSRPIPKPLTANDIQTKQLLPLIQPYSSVLQTVVSLLGAQQKALLLRIIQAKTEQLRSDVKGKVELTTRSEFQFQSVLAHILASDPAKELLQTLKRVSKDPKRFTEMTREESGRGNLPLYMFATMGFVLMNTKSGFEDSDFGEQQSLSGGYNPELDIVVQFQEAQELAENQASTIGAFIDKQLETAKTDKTVENILAQAAIFASEFVNVMDKKEDSKQQSESK